MLRAVAEAWRDRRGDVASAAAQLVEAVRRSSALRPSTEPLTTSRCSPARRAACAAQFDPHGAAGAGAPKFPPRLGARVPAAPRRDRDLRATTLDGMAAGGMYDLVGGGFHRYSVDERWLVPHFEKMLYDNALLVPAYLHGWLVHRRRALPRRRRGDGRLHAARAGAAGGRLRLGAGRRHGRRRGAHVHVDRGGGRAARSCSSRSSTAARSCAASSTEELRASSSSSASGGRSRCATTRRSRPGTGSRSRRSPRPGGALERPDWVAPARRLGEFLLGPLSDDDGRLGARSATGARAAPATSTTTRTSRTACSSCTSRPASCAGSRRRTGSRGSPSSSSPTRSTAASSSRRATASGWSRGRRSSTTTRRRPATRCSPTCCCGSRGSTATTSSSGARSPCSGSSARARAGAVARSAGRSARSTCTSARRASWRSSGRSTREVARAALEPWQPDTVVAVGAGRRRAAARRQGASSTGAPPSTSASGSRAGRRSPIRELRPALTSASFRCLSS